MIELTPHLVQVRYRLSFEPPGFEVVVTDNALRIAGQFAAVFFTRDAIDQNSLEEVFDTTIAAYRSIQQDVEITILEPR